MDRRLSRSSPIIAAIAACILGTAAPAQATSFGVTSLVTDDNANLASLGFSAAATEDKSLVNPWGISFAPTSPF